MSVSINKYIALSFIFICLALSGMAQKKSSAQLKKEQQKLKSELKYSENLLNETKKSKKLSATEVVIIDQKIKQREELIYSIQQEIDLLDGQIDEVSGLITSMEDDLKKLKDEYAEMIRHAYKSRSTQQRLMFILSSEDFNQAFRRLKYFQQYARYRQNQAEMIVKTQELLNEKIAELETIKQEKQGLIEAEMDEKSLLANERQSQQNVINKLSKKEKELRKEINKKKKKQLALQNAIKRAIEAEILAARKKREKEGEGGFAYTPEELALASNFAANKGKLPWPLEKGNITERFGKKEHPVLKGIYLNNNGVNFATLSGQKARAVFEGKVTNVFIIPGAGKAVMVRHGEYSTVYANLKETYVDINDMVSTKEQLGQILTDDGKTDFHFEIWKGTSPQNPALWLYKAAQ